MVAKASAIAITMKAKVAWILSSGTLSYRSSAQSKENIRGVTGYGGGGGGGASNPVTPMNPHIMCISNIGYMYIVVMHI